MASSGSDPVGPGRPPRVGLTTYLEPTRVGVWDRPAAVLPEVYLHAATEAGGVVLALPPQPVAPGAAAAVLDAVDALVLTGGADVGPARYGREPGERTDVPRQDRDAWELALLGEALRRGTPVLAVCRGLQLLDVALGGTLHQHLPDVVGHTGHSPGPAVFGTTRVGVVPGTRLARLLQPVGGGRGAVAVAVQCYHHQAVDRLGDGLVVSARAGDGTVEAVELPGPAFVVGVQWHTEEDRTDRRLFAALVAAAREHRAAAHSPAVRGEREPGVTGGVSSPGPPRRRSTARARP